MRVSAASSSAGIHAAVILGLFCLHHAAILNPPLNLLPPDLHRRMTKLSWAPTRSPGGGGQRDPLPASKGRLPDPPARRMFIPPVARILNNHPKLVLEQAILLDPSDTAPRIEMDRIGSPFGVDGLLSGGRGGPAGIGDAGCCGIGNDRGSGAGPGGAAQLTRASISRPARLPVLVYKVEPEYSEEARKARVQGVVVIVAQIDASGRAVKMRVARSLGLGLDERALEAVTRWRFRPALVDGTPAPFPVTIEVNFRLL